MTFYSREQLIQLLEVDEDLVGRLEQEDVVAADEPGGFSQLMLERVRVAAILVRDLGVNVEGVAIILRMREEIGDLHRELARLLAQRRA